MDFRFADQLKTVTGIVGIETFTNKYDSYEIIKVSGRRYLQGVGRYEDNWYIKFGDLKLLYFTINPILKTPPPINASPERYLKEIISDDFLLWWCEKYGLPWLEEVEPFDNVDYDAVSVSSFKNRIFKLYACSLLWNSIFFEDEQNLNLAMTLFRYKPQDFTNFNCALEKLKQELPKLISNEYQAQLKLRYSGEQGRYVFRWWTDRTFDVCFLQLATLITRSSEEIHSKQKSCRSCGRYFWGHGNQAFCSDCDRRTYWSRENKKKTQKF